jgi:hypothetical protein
VAVRSRLTPIGRKPFERPPALCGMRPAQSIVRASRRVLQLGGRAVLLRRAVPAALATSALRVLSARPVALCTLFPKRSMATKASSAPTETKRRDYLPPPFMVPTVDLFVRLTGDGKDVLVGAKQQMRLNPEYLAAVGAADGHIPDLSLDAALKFMTVSSVKVNGVEVPAEDLVRDPDNSKLIVKASALAPVAAELLADGSFTLETVNSQNPVENKVRGANLAEPLGVPWNVLAGARRAVHVRRRVLHPDGGRGLPTVHSALGSARRPLAVHVHDRGTCLGLQRAPLQREPRRWGCRAFSRGVCPRFFCSCVVGPVSRCVFAA